MLFLLSNHFIVKAFFLPYLWSFNCLHIYYTYFVWIVKSQNKKDAIDASSLFDLILAIYSCYPFHAFYFSLLFRLSIFVLFLYRQHHYSFESFSSASLTTGSLKIFSKFFRFISFTCSSLRCSTLPSVNAFVSDRKSSSEILSIFFTSLPSV